MSNGKGQGPGNHAEFNQPIPQRIKCEHDRQQDKFALMMTAQRKWHQQPDRRHFPEHGV